MSFPEINSKALTVQNSNMISNLGGKQDLFYFLASTHSRSLDSCRIVSVIIYTKLCLNLFIDSDWSEVLINFL